MKDIVGYEGLYAVTTCGKVWSYRNSNWLKHKLGTDGYPNARLCKEGKKKYIPIHRLVALAYIPNPENKPQVNHMDGVKTHSYLPNLEWVTRSENQRHAVATGLLDNAKNQRWATICCMRRVLQLDKITGRIIREFPTIKSTSEVLGNSFANVSNCCRNKRYSCKGYRWCYTDEYKSPDGKKVLIPLTWENVVVNF